MAAKSLNSFHPWYSNFKWIRFTCLPLSPIYYILISQRIVQIPSNFINVQSSHGDVSSKFGCNGIICSQVMAVCQMSHANKLKEKCIQYQQTMCIKFVADWVKFVGEMVKELFALWFRGCEPKHSMPNKWLHNAAVGSGWKPKTGAVGLTFLQILLKTEELFAISG